MGSAHYYSAHPLPEPAVWAAIAEPEARLRHGLREVYAYWTQNAATVANILRDAEVLGHVGVAGACLACSATPPTCSPAAGAERPAPPGTSGHHPGRGGLPHLQRLVRERGLSEQAAVELAVTWTRCTASPR